MGSETSQSMRIKVSHNQGSVLLSSSEIDLLLNKLARGHLSTCQEEYADLKRALVWQR